MEFTNWDFDFKVKPKNPEYNPPHIEDQSEWLKNIYKNILDMNIHESDEGHKHWTKRLSEDMTREDVLKYFKQVATQENEKNKKVDFADLLDKDDEGKRLLISMPQSIGDIYLCTSLLKKYKRDLSQLQYIFCYKARIF